MANETVGLCVVIVVWTTSIEYRDAIFENKNIELRRGNHIYSFEIHKKISSMK